MTTAQDPPRRRKEKARRAKQLAAWRLKKAASAPVDSEGGKSGSK
jgi:ribosomal protein L32